MIERYKPNTTVACVIYSQGKFLLVEECINGEIKFNQPAGHLEANESIVAACAREIIEETGLGLTPQAIVGIYQFQASARLAFVRYTFCIELAEQQQAMPLDPAITATHWLTLAEISALAPQLRSPLVLKSINDYLQQAGIPQAGLTTEQARLTDPRQPLLTPIHPKQHYPLSLLNADNLLAN